MKTRSLRSLLLGGLALISLPAAYAVADYLATPGGTLTVFAFVCQATKACPAHVPINSAGVEIMTTTTPAQVSLANTGANATALTVAGSLTNITGTVSLPTGASTSALQTTGNASLVTIATNTGTVPAGASTSALQTSGNSSLTTIATNTGALPPGASTSALQTSGNTSLTTIATNSGTQATAALQSTGNGVLSTIAANTSSPLPLLLGPTTGGTAQPQIGCNRHAFLHITTAATTNIVPGVTSQNVYVCGWRSRSAGVATWQLVESTATGTTCTTNTPMAGLATEAANTGEVMNPGLWSGLQTSAVSRGVCITSTGTGGVDVDVWYTQF